MAVQTEPKFTSVIPTRCIERHPNRRTIYFAGVPINLTYLADSFVPPLKVSTLSRIFRGERTPSVDMAERLAMGLGMQLQACLEWLKSERI